MKTKTFLILICLSLATTSSTMAGNDGKGISGDEHFIPVEMKLSGSIVDVGLYDHEGTLKDLKLFELNLKGSPGSASARGVGWGGSPIPYDALPAGNECIDIPSPVAGVMFEEFQMTMNFNDGSLLFANAVEGTGYVCFAPSIAVGTYEIKGGTKRFEGATGFIDAYIKTYRFNGDGHPSLVTAETGTLTGEIVIP